MHKRNYVFRHITSSRGKSHKRLKGHLHLIFKPYVKPHESTLDHSFNDMLTAEKRKSKSKKKDRGPYITSIYKLRRTMGYDA